MNEPIREQCWGLFYRRSQGTPSAAKLLDSTIYFDEAEAEAKANTLIEARELTVIVHRKAPPDASARNETMRQNAYAYVESDGEINLDSIADNVEEVKERCLEQWLGWRYAYTDMYDRDESWLEYSAGGQIMPITIEKATA